MKRINLGLIGWGTIGVGVTKIIEQTSESLAERLGAELYLKKVAASFTQQATTVQTSFTIVNTSKGLDQPEGNP